MDAWFIEDEQALKVLDNTTRGSDVTRGDDSVPALPGPVALRLHDLVIHDNKRWFDFLGGADIRVDVLAVQGNVLDDDPRSFYTPTTARFGGVGDESTVPLDDQGLLAYYGWPKHFIDISVMVSRDTSRADDLATLLTKEASSADFNDVVSPILQLALGGGALAVKNAVAVAATLGGLAYKVLRQVSGSTIGVYRGNRLEHPHRFGLGRNPTDGSYRRQNLSLWYDVVSAAEDAGSGT
ncbi:MAG: hypothetical protein ACRDZZ_08445 [Ilumatobacteraceae bacterium]